MEALAGSKNAGGKAASIISNETKAYTQRFPVHVSSKTKTQDDASITAGGESAVTSQNEDRMFMQNLKKGLNILEQNLISAKRGYKPITTPYQQIQETSKSLDSSSLDHSVQSSSEPKDGILCPEEPQSLPYGASDFPSFVRKNSVRKMVRKINSMSEQKQIKEESKAQNFNSNRKTKSVIDNEKHVTIQLPRTSEIEASKQQQTEDFKPIFVYNNEEVTNISIPCED